jgi:predicted MFS family arabinose efflux permease
MWFRNMTRLTSSSFRRTRTICAALWIQLDFFCAGLTAGPIIGGVLRDSIGYGDMNAVAAAISRATAVLFFIFIGGTLKFFSRAKQ